MGLEQTLVRAGPPLRQVEAKNAFDVTLYAGEVKGLSVNLLGRHEKRLRARVLQDVLPVFRALFPVLVIIQRKVREETKEYNLFRGFEVHPNIFSTMKAENSERRIQWAQGCQTFN